MQKQTNENEKDFDKQHPDNTHFGKNFSEVHFSSPKVQSLPQAYSNHKTLQDKYSSFPIISDSPFDHAGFQNNQHDTSDLINVFPAYPTQENSPIEAVRATVSKNDDRSLPCLTFRFWILSFLFTV